MTAPLAAPPVNTTAEALAALTAVLAPAGAYPVAVPSASLDGAMHHVVVVAGRVNNCDCKGWHYRKPGGTCRHARAVTDRILAVQQAVVAAAELLAGRAAVTFPDAS